MPVASFDVFDTLLTRTWAEPRDLFVALGRSLQARGLHALPPTQFAALRQTAEQSARRRQPSREITLAAIYDELAARIGWAADARNQALQEEIALETAAIRPVPGRLSAVQAARQRCGRVLFLSDMYLPASLIQGWLQQAGFFAPGDLLLVSGEAGAGKGDGGLFQIARQHLNSHADWVHQGDNPRADDAAPRALGLRTVLDQTAHLTPRELQLRSTSRYAPEWRSQLAGAARLARLEAPSGLADHEKTLWNLGAGVAGPLFLGYTRWCLDEATRRDLTDLYFLARGGQIFLRIAEQLNPPQGPRLHYLHTSRLAFSGAFDRDDLARLHQLAAPCLAHHSVRQTLANLGLEADELTLPDRWPRTRWDENLSFEERAALADWLLAPARIGQVQQALSARSERARDYLLAAGLGHRAAGLVDTGWMGTIQRNIEHLLGQPAGAAPLQGFYLGLGPVREFTSTGSYDAYTNTFRRLSLRREATHLILLELMARGDHSPLLGFSRQAGAVIPIHAPADAAQQREVRLFQAAILAFVRHSLSAGLTWPPHEIAAPVLIEHYLEFFNRPSRMEAEAIARIPHSDQILEQRHVTLCRPMSWGETLQAMTSYPKRPPGWWLAGQAQFGQAPLLHAYRLAKRAKWALQRLLTGRLD